MARRSSAQSAETQTAEQESPEMTTDTNDTQDTTVEAGTAEGGHKFNVGDEATVVRGRLRGRKGTIIKHNPNADTYAVELSDDGTLAVINAGNLKAPVDSTISVKALVGALAGFGQDAAGPDRDAAVRLAAMLDGVAPGISTKLNEAFAA